MLFHMQERIFRWSCSGNHLYLDKIGSEYNTLLLWCFLLPLLVQEEVISGVQEDDEEDEEEEDNTKGFDASPPAGVT